VAAVAVAVRQSSGLSIGIGIGTSRLGSSASRRGVKISNALAVTVLGVGVGAIVITARRIHAVVLVAVVLDGLVVVKRVLGLGGSGTARGARARGSHPSLGRVARRVGFFYLVLCFCFGVLVCFLGCWSTP